MSNNITTDLIPVAKQSTTARNNYGLATAQYRDNSVAWEKLTGEVQALIRSLATIDGTQAGFDALADQLAGKLSSAELTTALTALGLEAGVISNITDRLATLETFKGQQQTTNADVNSALGNKAAASDLTAAVDRIDALETTLGADETAISNAATLITALQGADVTTLSAIGTLETAVAALNIGTPATSKLELIGATQYEWTYITNEPVLNTAKKFVFYVNGVVVRPDRVSASGSGATTVYSLLGMPEINRPDETAEVWVEGVAA